MRCPHHQNCKPLAAEQRRQIAAAAAVIGCALQKGQTEMVLAVKLSARTRSLANCKIITFCQWNPMQVRAKSGVPEVAETD